jgi:hypothetical protein
MDTKDDINILSAKIDKLKESIRLKKESIEKEESELAELTNEYNGYIKEIIKCIKHKKIRSVSFKWFSYLLCHFSKEKGDYITNFDKGDVLTFFGEDKYGRITELFDLEVSTMLKENGYCNNNYKKFNLFCITNSLDNGCVSIYYTKNINESITKIDFSKQGI